MTQGQRLQEPGGDNFTHISAPRSPRFRLPVVFRPDSSRAMSLCSVIFESTLSQYRARLDLREIGRTCIFMTLDQKLSHPGLQVPHPDASVPRSRGRSVVLAFSHCGGCEDIVLTVYSVNAVDKPRNQRSRTVWPLKVLTHLLPFSPWPSSAGLAPNILPSSSNGPTSHLFSVVSKLPLTSASLPPLALSPCTNFTLYTLFSCPLN